MEKCRKLYEYSYFVEMIRKNQREGSPMEEAVGKAVQRCIDEGVLSDFLRKHRGEVMDLILTEYDEERHIKDEKNISYEEGWEEGREEGVKAMIETYQEFKLSRELTTEKLKEKFSLSQEEAEKYLTQYWND